MGPRGFVLASCLLAMARVGFGSDPNMWNYRDDNGGWIATTGDPSPGLNQRTCYHYYGPEPTRDGKEWATVKCNAPFDQVCILLKGEAELLPYEFRMSYVRGCHFRCPCPDSQPWVEWYKGYPGNDAYRDEHNIFRRWEKKCVLETPPKAYAVASSALPFTQVPCIFLPNLSLHENNLTSHVYFSSKSDLR